jgi:UDP-glucose 4-epimerase
MKALVTGGAGFIGSHLVELLVGEGHQVIAIDDLSSGKVENLDEMLGRYGFLFRVVDMLDTDALDDSFAGIDWVFHLAGTPSGPDSDERPGPSLRAHVQTTLQLLEYSRRHAVKSFVYAASAASYGNAELTPTPEVARLAPRAPHALTKAMGEELVLGWASIHRLPASSLRLFNVYGPRAPLAPDAGSVIPVFLAQKANRKPLTLAGDGRQTRDFVHVHDVTRAFLATTGRMLAGEAINVGSGRQVPIRDVAKLIGGDTIAVPARPGEPRRRLADIDKARKLLDWSPQVPFENGIAALLANLEDWKEAPVWTAETLEQLHSSGREERSPTDATQEPPPEGSPAVGRAVSLSRAFPLPF